MKKLVLSLLALLIVSCSSSSNKIEINKLHSEDRVFIGRIDLKFNGKELKDLTCELYINSEFSSSVRLSSDGYVFYKTKDHIVNFNQIGCLQRNAVDRRWHIYSLKTRPLKAPAKSNIVSYFGEVQIDWKTNQNLAGIENSRTLASNDQISQNRDISKIYNDGTFNMKVKNFISRTKKEFFTNFPEAKGKFVFGKTFLEDQEGSHERYKTIY